MEKYVKQNDYDSAKKIAEKYPDDEIVQYKLISICIETKRFEEGIKVALKYPDSKIIEDQLIILYTKTEKYDDAIEIHYKRLMGVYCKKRDYNEALKIAEKYPNNEFIQSKLIKLCIKMKKSMKKE